MKAPFRCLLAGVVLLAGRGLAQTPASVTRVRALLDRYPLIDGHNDLAYQLWRLGPGRSTQIDLARAVPQVMTDIPRLKAGKVGAQFWSVWVPVEHQGRYYKEAKEEIAVLQDLFKRYPVLAPARTAADIERLHAEGKIASLIGLESGHIIENSLGKLAEFYRLGVRYMTLTHWRNTEWADATTDKPKYGGLTPRGVALVHRMNELGMIVDVSHVSDSTMWDVLAATKAPVIASHSSVRVISNHPRNVPDDLLRAIAKNGGVVMVNFDAWYISQKTQDWYHRRDGYFDPIKARVGGDSARVSDSLTTWIRDNPPPLPDLNEVANHFDHIRRVAGVDHVGIGSDFDGTDYNPIGLDDVSKFPELLAVLADRGWSDAELGKVAGGNLLRVLRRVEALAEKPGR